MTRSPRALILERAIAGGLLGFVSLPFFDDLLSIRVRRVLLQDLARNRKMEVPEGALSLLARRRSRPVFSGALGGVLRRILRKVAAPLSLLQRAEEAFYVYGLGLLFDRHLETTGAPPLDAASAEALRSAIASAIAHIWPDVSTVRELFRGRWRGGTNLDRKLLASFEEAYDSRRLR